VRRVKGWEGLCRLPKRHKRNIPMPRRRTAEAVQQPPCRQRRQRGCIGVAVASDAFDSEGVRAGAEIHLNAANAG